MRGTLKPLAGVSAVDVTPGKREFTVVYDPARITPEKLIEELEKAGEGSKPQS